MDSDTTTAPTTQPNDDAMDALRHKLEDLLNGRSIPSQEQLLAMMELVSEDFIPARVEFIIYSCLSPTSCSFEEQMDLGEESSEVKAKASEPHTWHATMGYYSHYTEPTPQWCMGISSNSSEELLENCKKAAKQADEHLLVMRAEMKEVIGKIKDGDEEAVRMYNDAISDLFESLSAERDTDIHIGGYL